MKLLFINKINKAILDYVDNIDILPNVGNHINLYDEEYIIRGILFDYSKHSINAYVSKATANDVTYMN